MGLINEAYSKLSKKGKSIALICVAALIIIVIEFLR